MNQKGIGEQGPKFESLGDLFRDSFSKAFDELTEQQQRRVRSDLFGLWDEITVEQRHAAAKRWDYSHDPKTEDEREKAWEVWVAWDAMREEIDELERKNPLTVTETIKKADRLKSLRAKMTKLEHLDASPAARAARLLARRDELKAAGVRKFLLQLASEENRSVSRIKQVLKSATDAKAKTTTPAKAKK